MAFVKICGIQSFEEARAALDCGATALGFLVGLTHRAEDGIGEAEAHAIIGRLPVGAEVVLVTHLRDPGVRRLCLSSFVLMAGFVTVYNFLGYRLLDD